MGALVWITGAAAVVYEAYAWLTGKPTISHVRGWWRVGLIGWIITFTVHLFVEWTSDDIALAAAESFGDLR